MVSTPVFEARVRALVEIIVLYSGVRLFTPTKPLGTGVNGSGN